MGISRTWCQSGEFVLECEKHTVVVESKILKLGWGAIRVPKKIPRPHFHIRTTSDLYL